MLITILKTCVLYFNNNLNGCFIKTATIPSFLLFLPFLFLPCILSFSFLLFSFFQFLPFLFLLSFFSFFLPFFSSFLYSFIHSALPFLSFHLFPSLPFPFLSFHSFLNSFNHSSFHFLFLSFPFFLPLFPSPVAANFSVRTPSFNMIKKTVPTFPEVTSDNLQ